MNCLSRAGLILGVAFAMTFVSRSWAQEAAGAPPTTESAPAAGAPPSTESAPAATAAPLPPPALPLPPPPPLTEADGQAIAAALEQGRAEGLPAPDIAGLLKDLSATDPAPRRQAQDAVAAAAVTLARAARGQRIDPHLVSNDWPSPPPYDAIADFDAARRDGRVAAWADGLSREDAGYNALVAARARYAAVVEKGGWAPIEPLSASRRVDRRALTLAVAARVAQEGFDDLADFQRHHGLTPDGALTEATLEALNVPAEARLATIDANLERARWFADPLPSERVEADIAGATVDFIIGGKSMLPMRAIVGDDKHHTPMLSSRFSSIVFNPPWVVPTRIAAEELWPKEHAHPGYLAAHGYKVIDGQLVQTPGPHTALGYVKFDFPNPYSVYLHDTPGRNLFARDARGLSHGCVRVEHPRYLAWALLAPQEMTLEDVDALIAARTTRRIPLQARRAIYILYRTAVADEAGKVSFRPDVYGWDARLLAALSSKPPASGTPAGDSEVSDASGPQAAPNTRTR